MKKITLFAILCLATLATLTQTRTQIKAATLAAEPFTTFLGGGKYDGIIATAIGDDGTIVVVGRTTSPDYPTTTGVLDTDCGEGVPCGDSLAYGDAFVTKFATDGTVIFSTFLGGDEDDGAEGVAIAPDGTIVVVGYTLSLDFPTTAGAFDSTFNELEGVSGDGFVVRLSSDGKQLLYGTYVGGLRLEKILAVDLHNNDIFFAGFTRSDDFPTTAGAFDRTMNGDSDVFVGKFSADGSQLLFSTFLGGSDHDFGFNLAVDNVGNVAVVGQTRSANYPATGGALDTTLNGSSDGFVTKLNSNGSALLYSTFVGGNSFDDVSDIEFDTANNAYIIGTAASSDFLATQGAFDIQKSNQDDGYFSILNAAGSQMTYNTFVSKTQTGRFTGVSLALGVDDTVFLGVSWTETGGFGDRVPYVLQLDPAGNGEDDLLFDCRLCYRFDEGILTDIKNGPNGIVIVGDTNDPGFPVTPNAFDKSLGVHDGFIIAQPTPITDDVDLFVTMQETVAGAPNGNVVIPMFFGNLGATTADNVFVTATLDAGLVYISDSTGTAPVVNGNELTWEIHNMLFGGRDAFDLVLQLPDEALGTQFDVAVTVVSDGPEAFPANNSASVTIKIASQTFLPLVSK